MTPTAAPPQPGYTPQPGYYQPQPGYPSQPGYPPMYPYAPVQPGSGYGPNPWLSAVPPGPTPGLVWGGIGVRFGALVLDAVAFVGFLAVVGALLGALGFRTADGVTIHTTASDVFIGSYILIMFLWVPTCWYVFEGTIGQRLLGLRVVRASDGRPLGLGRVFVRYLMWTICLVTVVAGVIAAAIASGDPYKRAWPDNVADSVVVKRV